jgi:hypothetical protein
VASNFTRNGEQSVHSGFLRIYSQWRVILLAVASSQVTRSCELHCSQLRVLGSSSQMRVFLLAGASDECQYGQKPKNHNFSPIFMIPSSK